MDANQTTLPPAPPAELPPGQTESPPPAMTPLQKEQMRRQRIIIITMIIVGVVLLAVIIGSIIYLAQPGTNTARIRDIMIIFMAFEMMVLGVSMVILLIQLATLINLLQNDVKPILDATNETANTLRGTALFLSDNLSEPVIKMNEYASAVIRLVELIGLVRRR